MLVCSTPTSTLKRHVERATSVMYAVRSYQVAASRCPEWGTPGNPRSPFRRARRRRTMRHVSKLRCPLLGNLLPFT